MEPALPGTMRGLKNLKTLHLELCKLGDIGMICELIKLLVLSLCDSILEEFPVDIVNLVNLRILDMGGCKVNLNRASANKNVIASLCSLEGLHLFDNFKEWANKTTCGSIAELRYLNSLEVDLQDPQHLPIAEFAKNLNMFNIRLTDDPYSFLQEKIKPLCRALEIHVDTSLEVSDCLELLLKKADCVRLYTNSVKNNIVLELDVEGFRDLKYLEVKYCESMECVVNTNGLNDLIAFQDLEHLSLESVNLQMICKGEAPPGMFYNLQYLELKELDNLQYSLPLALLPPKLTRVCIASCKSLKCVFIENEIVPSDGELEEHKEADTIEFL